MLTTRGIRGTLMLAALLAGLVSPNGADAQSRTDANYVIGPEDVLSVTVARHPELGGEAMVLPNGAAGIPNIGELLVAGRTTAQVEAEITSRLTKKLVRPQVVVAVKVPRPQRVWVSGAVKTPGALAMRSGWRVTEAIAEAGGLLVKPERGIATLFRAKQTINLDLDAIYIQRDPAANVELQPGDNVDVQEPPTMRVTVSGQVGKQGILDIQRGATLVDALTQAGGPLPMAALSRVVIQRTNGSMQTVDASRLLEGSATESAPRLEAGDFILVPENDARFAVMGKVRQPNVFPLRDGEVTTVADAIALAGGLEPRAEPSRIGVVRTRGGTQEVIEVNLTNLTKGRVTSATMPLQSGDVVVVPETRKVDWQKVFPGVGALSLLLRLFQ
jgi:protein involved in polysaccharide export with SLBB domain